MGARHWFMQNALTKNRKLNIKITTGPKLWMTKISEGIV